MGSQLVADQEWFNLVVFRLDAVLDAAAAQAGFDYVPAYDAFDGHELCTASPDANSVDLHGFFDAHTSFHPNAAGQQALETLVEQQVRADGLFG